MSTDPITGLSGGVTQEDMREQLAKHPFLRGLPTALLEELQVNALPAAFAPEEWIFREGDPANRFYLLQSGRVRLESVDPDGVRVVLEELGPGDVLGWSWLFPPYYWHFDARAVEPTRGIFLYGTRLREQCDANHDLGYEILRRVSEVIVNRLQHARRELTRVYHHGGG